MSLILLIILQSLYFILPAGVANMSPVLCRKIHLPGSFPINKRLFGKNKTWKGLGSGVVGAILILLLQRFFAQQGYRESIVLLDYESISILLYGVLFGLGALLGDLAESYIKRKKGIKAGAPRAPRDQLDWVTTAIIATSLVYTLPLTHILTLLIITPLLHIIINGIGYLLGLKDVWR